MKVIVVYIDEQFSKPISYIFDLMLSILGLEHEILPYSELNANRSATGDLLISYGRKKIDLNADRQIHIYQSKLFGRDYRTLSSMPQLPLKRWNGLPVIYVGNGGIRDLVAQSENMIETNIDIIASSFFMLTRYEEILVDERDQYDRFPATASIAYKESFLNRPIVNEYISLLWKWIDSFNLGFESRTLWGGKELAVLLTHDVDSLWRYRWWRPPVRAIARSVANDRQFAKSLHYFWDWIAPSLKIKPDPFWTFDYITDLEHRHRMSSSFYFMTGGNTEYDPKYIIDNPKITKLLRSLEDMGHEVGFHGSFNSYNDHDMFASEKSKLDQLVSNRQYGGRQHFLRWKNPETWRIWEKAEMFYDTTLSYADQEGFRCGICLPFKPFDVLEDRVLDIWELPLIIMDGTLNGYRNLSPEQAYEAIMALLDQVTEHHGLFVMLWHNSHLYEVELAGWKHLYERVMEECSSRNVFNRNGRDTVCHWTENLEVI